jgi:hypothetical protein
MQNVFTLFLQPHKKYENELVAQLVEHPDFYREDAGRK